VTFLATGSVGKEPEGGYKYHNDQKNHDETADAPALIGRTPRLDVNNLPGQTPKPLSAGDG
jgi:hypothetical protein